MPIILYLHELFNEQDVANIFINCDGKIDNHKVFIAKAI